MRVKRVGSFTVGISLIFTGIILLLSLFEVNIDLVEVIKFVPTILILLGVEILLAPYLYKADEYKYDLLTVFLCTVMVCGCLLIGIGVQYMPLFSQCFNI